LFLFVIFVPICHRNGTNFHFIRHFEHLNIHVGVIELG
jgi:hypothetical protein